MSAADGVRLYTAAELDPHVLAARKGATSVSVCLPARNEAATLGPIIDVIIGELMAAGPGGQPALVDELLVLDDGSTDATAAVAAAHGARVVSVDTVLPELGAGRGKGNVLWRSLAVAAGELIVWCDADVTSFRADYVTGLLAPLLEDRAIGFVKGFYDRPTAASGHGGGRVTELVARPLLSRFFPAWRRCASCRASEMAGRRAVLEAAPFAGLRRRDAVDRHHQPLSLRQRGAGRSRRAPSPAPAARRPRRAGHRDPPGGARPRRAAR
ncbi:MAG: glycosyltransferase [Acidimicrobiales bacterium]